MDRSTELVRAGSEHRAPAPTRQRGHLTGADRRRCLATVCAIQFIGLLDTSMVSVALPSIGHGLHLAPAVLQWVLNAYTIVFSGFVLLGGRAADVFGQRRTLLAGLGMVAAGALASGGASSTGMLLAARAAQGLGAAIALPTAVSCLVTTFEEGAERNRAFSLYAASGCLAMVLGSLLGGFLTAQGGWRTVFVFTIALCAAGAALALLSPFEDGGRAGPRGFDVAGAVLAAACLGTLVYGLIDIKGAEWSPAHTMLMLTGAAALGLGFVAAERRSAAPLVRLGLLRIRTVAGANLLSIVFPAGFLATQFLGSLLLQEVLGLGALPAGIGFLPFSLTLFWVTLATPRLLRRLGAGRVACLGFTLLTIGLVLLSQAGGQSYTRGVLPAFLILGVGMALASVPLAVAAVAGVSNQESGMASGLLSTSQQMGGAVMLAVLADVTSAGAGSVAVGGVGADSPLAHGLQAAFLCAAALCALAAAGAPHLLVRDRQV